jgi:hypothetical protein
MPLRLGLLSESGQEDVALVVDELARKRVIEAMTSPVVIIVENQPLADAEELFLGLIPDNDLFRAFQPDKEGVRSLLDRMAKPF